MQDLRKEEQELLKARTKLFEIEQKRLQREEQQAAEKEDVMRQFFDRLRGTQTLPGSGLPLMDPQAAPKTLTELLADPEGAALALRAGAVGPQDLMPQEAKVNPQIEFLRGLQENPELAAIDQSRRAAGATQVKVDTGIPNVPAGYYRPDPKKPGLVPEPGGPVDEEKRKAAEAALSKQESVVEKTQSVTGEIDKAIGLITPMTAGFASKLTRDIDGTQAFELQEALKTVQANIGFDTLQRMRAESPTGGALGQVAVKELEGLQNSITSLNQGLRPGQLRENLRKVRGHYERWRAAVMKARAQGEMPEAPAAGGVIDFNDLPDDT